MKDKPPLGAVFRVALYYGFAGFGGGYSVLAQLRRDLVERRRWLTQEEFLVLAELSKSLPGTPATNLLALLGQQVGGVRGGVFRSPCSFDGHSARCGCSWVGGSRVSRFSG